MSNQLELFQENFDKWNDDVQSSKQRDFNCDTLLNSNTIEQIKNIKWNSNTEMKYDENNTIKCSLLLYDIKV